MIVHNLPPSCQQGVRQYTDSFAGKQILNRHEFKTLPACKLINLTSLVGRIIYMREVYRIIYYMREA